MLKLIFCSDVAGCGAAISRSYPGEYAPLSQYSTCLLSFVLVYMIFTDEYLDTVLVRGGGSISILKCNINVLTTSYVAVHARETREVRKRWCVAAACRVS